MFLKKYLTWDIFNKKMTENDFVFFLQNFEEKNFKIFKKKIIELLTVSIEL